MTESAWRGGGREFDAASEDRETFPVALEYSPASGDFRNGPLRGDPLVREPGQSLLLDAASPPELPREEVVHHDRASLPEVREPVLIRGDLQDVRQVSLLEKRREAD